MVRGNSLFIFTEVRIILIKSNIMINNWGGYNIMVVYHVCTMIVRVRFSVSPIFT